MPKLVITDDDGVREVSLQPGDVLGRVAENAICVPVAEASRRHCRFSFEQGSWWIEDLGSSNGTQLNGRKTTKAELQDGDVLAIGKVTLRFLDAEVAAEEPTSAGWAEDDEISLEVAACLILEGGGRVGEIVPLPEGRITVGRKARHAIHLPVASVSGDHAELVRQGAQATLRDLGSSNGTAINGRKISESTLKDGDEVFFGDVRAVYRLGTPADLQAERLASASAETQPEMREADVDHLAVSSGPPTREWIWNLAAFAIVAGLGAMAYLVFTNQSSSTGDVGRSGARGDDLLPKGAASFEFPETSDAGEVSPEWIKLDLADAAEVDEAFDADSVRSGDRALVLSLVGEGPRASVVRLDLPIPVSAGTPYRLGVSARGAGTALVELAWFGTEERSDSSVFLTHDRALATVGRGAWTSLEAVGVAPPGAKTVRVGVGVLGSSRVTFDDAYLLRETAAPEGRCLAQGDFAFSLDPALRLRVGRLGRVVLDGLGLYRLGESGDWPQESLAVLGSDPARAILGQGVGELEARLESSDGRPELRWTGPALTAATGFEFLVPSRSGAESLVTVLSGDRGVRLDRDFVDQTATALIVAQGGDQMRIDFRGPDGSPVALRTSRDSIGGVPRLRVAGLATESLVLSFRTDFSADQAEASSKLAEARNHLRDRPGQAATLLADILARFPAQEAITAAAATELAALEDRVAAEVDQLAIRVDDAVFFGRAGDVDLRNDLAATAAKIGGTSRVGVLSELSKRLAAAAVEQAGKERESAAERLFQRARDYLDGERRQLARFLFQEVVSRYPETEWAEQASPFLTSLSQPNKGQD